MADEKKPSDRIRKGMAAFADIAEKVEQLESDLEDEKQTVAERDSMLEELQRDLEAIQPIDPLLDDLRDVRSGVRDFEEILDKWLGYEWKPAMVKAA